MTDKYKYLFLKTVLLFLVTMSLKIRTENFCPDDSSLLIDIV